MIKIISKQIQAEDHEKYLYCQMDMNFKFSGAAEQITNEAVAIMTALPKELKKAGGNQLLLQFLAKLATQDNYGVEIGDDYFEEDEYE